MNLKHKCSILFFLLLTTIPTQAANNTLQTTKPVTANAYFLDTVLWPYNTTTKTYNIPVCWESLAVQQSTATERQAVRVAIINTWQKYSLARFTGWGICPSSTTIFGITITVNNFADPRAALGTQGIGKLGVMRLNFRLNTIPLTLPPIPIFTQCRLNFPGITLTTCIQSTAIHEFGHILGMAHEQNRSDDALLFILPCHKNDLNPTILPQGSFTTFGNTLFTDYDITSVMNYCRANYAGRTDLSPKDQLAIRVYYGQMAGYDSRTLILTVPRIERYDGKVFTGRFKWIKSNIWQQIGALTTSTTPSKSPAKLNSSGVLTIQEIKYINLKGHVNQVLNGTFRPGLPGAFFGSWYKVQPLTFPPVPY